MATKVYVTGAQQDAARMIVERSKAKGKSASAPVRKIADATIRPRTIEAKTPLGQPRITVSRPAVPPADTRKADSASRSNREGGGQVSGQHIVPTGVIKKILRRVFQTGN